MAYLIDTDIFIAAKNLHYGMDFCPGFWDWLVHANAAGKLLSIQAVCDDLTPAGDQLTAWAKARDDSFFVPPDNAVIPALAQVATWINAHGTYTSAAKGTFLGCSDYFIVAQALAGGHTVITHEIPANSVHRVKIPNVCAAMNISCKTCWQMLRDEGIKLKL